MFKNVPILDVYEIADHACVSLKQIVLLSSGHGAIQFFLPYGGKPWPQNHEGLHDTKATDDLQVDMFWAQKKNGIDKETIMWTKIGYIYFCGDGFLNHFIKQKENSV